MQMRENPFKNKIVIIDEVLSTSECAELIEFYKNEGPTHSHRDTLVMDINLGNKFLKDKINKIKYHSVKIAPPPVNIFNIQVDVDWAQIVQWPKNSYQLPHLDSFSSQTVFTSITYLNDDYSGGKTYIVDDIKIIPKVGRTVFFDGNHYRHGVSKIHKKTRYTLPIWYKLKS